MRRPEIIFVHHKPLTCSIVPSELSPTQQLNTQCLPPPLLCQLATALHDRTSSEGGPWLMAGGWRIIDHALGDVREGPASVQKEEARPAQGRRCGDPKAASSRREAGPGAGGGSHPSPRPRPARSIGAPPRAGAPWRTRGPGRPPSSRNPRRPLRRPPCRRWAPLPPASAACNPRCQLWFGFLVKRCTCSTWHL